MEKLKECPNCKSNNLKDCYVYIRCNDCLMEGPKTNRGNYDDHADYLDHEKAIELWNGLPRKKSHIKPKGSHD
jgi:hypothetical protein